MDYDKDDIYFFIEVEKDKYIKFIPYENVDNNDKEVKDLLPLKKCDKESDKMTLLALSNFLIVNSSYYN
jgi:hypothetical protein